MGQPPRDLVGEFGERYRIVEHPALMRAERSVIGADYGATSYTTRAEADRMADLLGITAEQLVLDVGSGAGWPGVYVASETGCRMVLSDLPMEGLAVAIRRSGKDRARCHSVPSSGDALPFRDAVFDVVMSSDVLC